jgi:hypothetical protein
MSCESPSALSAHCAERGTHLTQGALKIEASYKNMIWRIKERSAATIGEDGTCSKLVIASLLFSTKQSKTVDM